MPRNSDDKETSLCTCLTVQHDKPPTLIVPFQRPRHYMQCFNCISNTDCSFLRNFCRCCSSETNFTGNFELLLWIKPWKLYKSSKTHQTRLLRVYISIMKVHVRKETTISFLIQKYFIKPVELLIKREVNFHAKIVLNFFASFSGNSQIKNCSLLSKEFSKALRLQCSLSWSLFPTTLDQLLITRWLQESW